MIDISRFKVIYRNKVLNAVAILNWDTDPVHNKELFAHGYHTLGDDRQGTACLCNACAARRIAKNG